MKLSGLLMLGALAAVSAQASDYVRIYGVISKVVFEPGSDHPQRVQVFGAFSIAGNTNGMVYLPAQRGYLYFTLEGLTPDRQEAAVHEWKDLASVAGTNTAIAFSGRLVGPGFAPPRVRKEGEKPSQPEVYRLGTGTTKMAADSRYEPVAALFQPIQ